jgi:NAD(P)-dependent dehydrogenase (short-subunit alcohol dehydrogenase family)
VSHALVFGGTGALGSAAVAALKAEGWAVTTAGRTPGTGVDLAMDEDSWADAAAATGPFDGVVWAQGSNLSGGALDTEPDDLHRLFEANVVFITQTLRRLVAASALSVPARGVVLSSVWQITARSNKLAYVASKAALAGVIPAIAIDLAQHRFAINGVLPGVIDTPMTRANLSEAQLERVQAETIGGALATPADVGRAVAWLLDPRAAGINAQWIAVDNGWSAVRSV